MKTVRKHTVVINGRQTSYSLEPAFFAHLKAIAAERKITLRTLVGEVNAARTMHNLSAHLRVYVLEYFQARAALNTPPARCPDDRTPASTPAVHPEPNPAHVQHLTE